MSRPYRQGLVVGKFCPLHIGHEFLIQQAQQHCEALTILSYTMPGFEGYEAARREHWLRSRFAQAQVVVLDPKRLSDWCAAQHISQPMHMPADTAHADEHRHFVAWLCQHLLHTKVDAVFTSEDYGDGFAKALAHFMGQAVDHVCVDRHRAHFPVSGSMIRANPHAYRHAMSPVVYASFVRRIAILGGESSGKTTLAAALAQRLGTNWVPEYGRELWAHRSGQLRYADMLHIAQTQLAREEALAGTATQWLVCDTTPLTTQFYAQAWFGQVQPALQQLAVRAYDHTILCAADFPFVQDGTRQSAAFSAKQHAWYVQQLMRQGQPCLLATGSISERVQSVLRLLYPA